MAILFGWLLSADTMAVNSVLTVATTGSASGVVTSNVGAINCGATCTDSYANGTVITLTAAPVGGSQFTGWLGPCTGLGSCQFTIAGPTTLSATFAAPAIGAKPFDIDGTGTQDALTDGLLALRYLFGLSGSSLINGAVGAGASRSAAPLIEGYLADARPLLDIDGNGQADALTDGLLLIRYLFGLRGATLISGAVGPGASRTTSTAIEAYLAKGLQSIAFSSTPPAGAAVGGSPYNVSVSASSGLPVVLTVEPAVPATVCTIAGSTVSFVGVGTCVIDANQAGDPNYFPAPQVKQTFPVGKGNQAITITSTAPANATVGLTPYTPTATATSGLAVVFTIDPVASAVCTISNSTVSFVGPGTCVVNADQPGNADYKPALRAQQAFGVAARAMTTTTLPFSDPFTASPGNVLGNNWFEQAGHFSTASGKAAGQAAFNSATLFGLSATNVTVQADIALTADGQSAGLIARHSGPLDNNEYVATVFRVGGAYHASIDRIQGGIPTRISTQSIANGTGTLLFEVAGPSLKLFLSNVLVAFAYDTALATGSVGIQTSATTTVDNFLASALTLPSVTLPFADAFGVATNQQLSHSWVEQRGNFQVLSGVATGQDTMNSAILNGLAATNLAMQADVNLIADGQLAGLIARQPGPLDNNNYVAFVSRSAGLYQAAIWRTQGGVATQLSARGIGGATGTLRLEAAGPSLKLFLNNVLLAFAQDSTFTSGTAGVRASAGVALDNFVASALTLPVASLPFSDNFTPTVNQQLSSFWLEQAGNYQVTAGGVATGKAATNLALVNGISAVNVTVAATVAIPLNGFAGFVGRYSGPGDSNHYEAIVTRLAGGSYTAQIYKNIGGIISQLGSASVATFAGALAFKLLGTSLTLTMDGIDRVTVNDASIAGSGALGIRVGNAATVDNFTAN